MKRCYFLPPWFRPFLPFCFICCKTFLTGFLSFNSLPYNHPKLCCKICLPKTWPQSCHVSAGSCSYFVECLLCVRHYTKCSIASSKLITTSTLSSRDFCSLCSRIRKQSHRVITEIVQRLMTRKRRSRDLNSGTCNPEPTLSQSLCIFLNVYIRSPDGSTCDICHIKHQVQHPI